MQRWGNEQATGSPVLLRAGLLMSLASLGTAGLVLCGALAVGAPTGADVPSALGTGLTPVTVQGTDRVDDGTTAPAAGAEVARPVPGGAPAGLGAAAVPAGGTEAADRISGAASSAAQTPTGLDELARPAHGHRTASQAALSSSAVRGVTAAAPVTAPPETTAPEAAGTSVTPRRVPVAHGGTARPAASPAQHRSGPVHAEARPAVKATGAVTAVPAPQRPTTAPASASVPGAGTSTSKPPAKADGKAPGKSPAKADGKAPGKSPAKAHGKAPAAPQVARKAAPAAAPGAHDGPASAAPAQQAPPQPVGQSRGHGGTDERASEPAAEHPGQGKGKGKGKGTDGAKGSKR